MSVEIQMARGLRVHVDVPAAVSVQGASAREAVDELIASFPQLQRFVLDDARRLRQHVNIYINDALIRDREQLSDPLASGDRLYILPAVSGGADSPASTIPAEQESDMSNMSNTSEVSEAGLLVSTRKGLLLGCSRNARREWQWSDLQRGGWIVDYAMYDPRSGKVWCAASHWQWGPRLHYSRDWGETWIEAGTPSFDDGARSVEAIWMLEPGVTPGTLYAGIMPGALFASDDDGESWREVSSLAQHPAAEHWEPGAAGLVIHHISVDPDDPQRLVVSGSATGVMVSYDGGDSWQVRNEGIFSEHFPAEFQQGAPCVHSLLAHPRQRGRLWQQNHVGQYRSDDDGQTWINVGQDLPGIFGFPTAIDPSDPDVCYFVPHDSDQARMPYDGALAVYRTRDAGASWSRLADGLPQSGFHQTVYRHALGQDGGDPLGVYFGSSGGELYGSRDAGEHWTLLREHLAPITAVRAFPLPAPA